MNPLSSLFVLAVSPWCGYCLSDCLIYGGSSMRVLTSMCVCVNCRMTVCYNYRARERGSVVGKVLCDEGLRLRKGLWQRLKDRKGREIRMEGGGGLSQQLAFQTLAPWNSRSLPLSPVPSALHPFFSSLPSKAICSDLQMQASEACDVCQSKNDSKHRSWECSSLHKQQCWGMTVQTED